MDLPAEMHVTALISPTARGELPPLTPAGSSSSRLQSRISIQVATHSTEHPLGRIRTEQLETPGLLRRLGADLYHGLAFAAPLRVPCPTIITVYDLSFITRPKTHKTLNRMYLSLATRWSCRHAARVIAISEWSRHDVVEFLSVDPARVDVIALGVDPRFHPGSQQELAQFKQANRIGVHTVFFLGSLEPRKNLPVLIDAFKQVLEAVPDAELIVGGGRGWNYTSLFRHIQELGLDEKVRFLGPVPADDVPKWMNACTVFAYPSLYEGFGLPVLEAMACGAAVVASNVTSLPEVAGDAGLLVPPADTQQIAQALGRVLTDESLRATLRQRGLQRATQFTWRRTAEKTVESYNRALQETQTL